MSSELIEAEHVSNLPVVRDRASVLLAPVMDVNTAMKRLEEFQQFCANYLQESKDGGNDGGDYGIIPGAGKKKILLKSGADKLCEVYGLYDEYIVLSSVEDWEKGLFDYTLKCVLKSRRDDSMVGAGLGSCSSYESKYRWRDQQRTCPQCGLPAIIKGKTEYGGGWLCFAKKGGCGAKFKDGDKSIEGQTIGRIENPDIIDTKNTVIKMAKKRAKIDATIGVTRSSGLFTQDLDEIPPIQQTPTKPPVERTTEDIIISGPAKGNSAAAPENSQAVGTEKQAQRLSPAATTEPVAAPAPAPAIEYVTQGQAVNFERTFKDACMPGVNALDEAHAWLFNAGYVDPKTGKPSAKFIPKLNFEQIKASAKTYAQQLKPRPNIVDEDIPF